MVRRGKAVRIAISAIIALLCAAAFAAAGTFLEPDVRVLEQFDGDGSQSFGRAVSPVAAPGKKHRLNALISEAWNGRTSTRVGTPLLEPDRPAAAPALGREARRLVQLHRRRPADEFGSGVG